MSNDALDPKLSAQMRARLDNRRENETRLAGCPRPHDFLPTGDTIPQTQRPRYYHCRTCGGVLHWELAEQYMSGLADGIRSGASAERDKFKEKHHA